MPRDAPTKNTVTVLDNDWSTSPMKVIVGGFLPIDEAWIPSIVDIDGEHFVSVCKRDRKLSSFCGVSLSKNKFIDDLLQERNRACDAILRQLAQNGESIEGGELVKGKITKKTMALQAPKTVVLKFEAIDGSVGVEIPVVFESDSKVSCAVKVSADVMDYICIAVKGSEQGDRGKKRNAEDRQTFQHREVRANYSRGSLYVEYLDADGRSHTKHAKPDVHTRSSEDEREAAMQACAEELHVFYTENHHPPQQQ